MVTTRLKAAYRICIPMFMGFYEILLSSYTCSASMPILPNDWQLKGVSPSWIRTMPTGACGPWPKWSAFHREIDGTCWVQKPQQEPPYESDYFYAAYQSVSLRHWQMVFYCHQYSVKKDSTNSNFWCITRDAQLQRWFIVSQHIICA